MARTFTALVVLVVPGVLALIVEPAALATLALQPLGLLVLVALTTGSSSFRPAARLTQGPQTPRAWRSARGDYNQRVARRLL